MNKLNYYGIKELINLTLSIIIETLEKQIEIVKNKDKCICIGKGKNLEFLKKHNKEKRYFKQIEVCNPSQVDFKIP